MSGIEGQVSKLATLIKNFLPGLACGKATRLRLFDPDESKAVCFLHWQQKIPLQGFFF